MSSPFVAEIRIFGFNFAPTGWAQCNGQLLPISQNTALFSLLGTFYGGDGKSTFALPNLQGMAPIHQGQGPGLSERFLGESAGEEFVTLIQSEMPSHAHSANSNNVEGSGTSLTPSGQIWAGAGARRAAVNLYTASAALTQMNFGALSIAGGSQPHNNMPPYLTLNFCIAMQGVFPPRP
jgi:microcystin-dependent protein